MKKERLCRSVTKENLASAYWTLYKEKGTQKITVKEIITLAGYNRSTFYKYFKDVYDVQEYIENAVLDSIKQMIVNLEHVKDEEVINGLANMYESNEEYLSVLLSEKGNPMFVKRFKNLMKEIMSQSVPYNKQNPYAPYIFEYMTTAAIGAITSWFQNKDDVPLRALIKMMRKLNTGAPIKELMKSSHNTD